MKKTKIVCTVGPSSSSPETLERLITSGMDVARLNFSHGTHESHMQVIDTIRAISAKVGKPVALLQDLCGPKIRLGDMAAGPSPVVVNRGDRYTFVDEEIVGDAAKATITYKNLYHEVQPGNRILIDDGLIEMKVVKIVDRDIECEVVAGGPLSSHKGVNLPGIALSIPALTEKDIADLRFGLGVPVDLVAISFVRKEEDILLALSIMKEAGRFLPIIAKVEKQEAVDNIEGILRYCDGIMVARGDMGVEIPFEEVPLIQKKLISLCREKAKPVITATQMLDSMIRNPRPTRAEVTDVANAILDGTDAIMLSGETASGKYPLESVQAMASIADYTEKFLPYESIFLKGGEKRNAVEAISLATCEIAEQMQARAIVILTSSGRTARAIAKYRPRQPVIAVTDSPEAQRRMMLQWGVIPVLAESVENTDQLIEEMCTAALKTGTVREGDLIVLTAGVPEGMKGSTNTIKLHVLGHDFIRGIGAGLARSVSGRICFAHTCQKSTAGENILVLDRIEEKYENLIWTAGALIIQENDLSPRGNELLKKASKPAVIGIPGAMEALHDGALVTVDSERGLVFIGHA